ncbi:MAG: transposase [Syntrophales bacterium]|nr:transposase [Syntrophales bacterium]
MEGKNLMTAKSSIVQKESGIRAVPDPEVTEKAVRRKFTAAFKLRILKEAEACTQQGQLGALLRREGLYYSNLTSWRRQINQGLIPKKRGPLAKRPDPHARRIVELERENAKLTHKLKHAELIIDVQKNNLKCNYLSL